MKEVLFLLPIFLSPVMLLAFFVLTKGRRLHSRIIWTGLAVLLSLPLGVIAVFESIIWMTQTQSPGIGVAALPVVLGWLAAALLWFVSTAYALAGRLKNRSQNSN